MVWEERPDAKMPLPENNMIRDRDPKRYFIFAEREGGQLEVWQDPKGEHYARARRLGYVVERPLSDLEFHRRVNWIATAVLDDDYDFTLEAPRETA